MWSFLKIAKAVFVISHQQRFSPQSEHNLLSRLPWPGAFVTFFFFFFFFFTFFASGPQPPRIQKQTSTSKSYVHRRANARDRGIDGSIAFDSPKDDHRLPLHFCVVRLGVFSECSEDACCIPLTLNCNFNVGRQRQHTSSISRGIHLPAATVPCTCGHGAASRLPHSFTDKMQPRGHLPRTQG